LSDRNYYFTNDFKLQERLGQASLKEELPQLRLPGPKRTSVLDPVAMVIRFKRRRRRKWSCPSRDSLKTFTTL
jgi:hypothetical protein